MINYRDKYLKYKNKYNNIKYKKYYNNYKGGAEASDDDDIYSDMPGISDLNKSMHLTIELDDLTKKFEEIKKRANHIYDEKIPEITTTIRKIAELNMNPGNDQKIAELSHKIDGLNRGLYDEMNIIPEELIRLDFKLYPYIETTESLGDESLKKKTRELKKEINVLLVKAVSANIASRDTRGMRHSQSDIDGTITNLRLKVEKKIKLEEEIQKFRTQGPMQIQINRELNPSDSLLNKFLHSEYVSESTNLSDKIDKRDKRDATFKKLRTGYVSVKVVLGLGSNIIAEFNFPKTGTAKQLLAEIVYDILYNETPIINSQRGKMKPHHPFDIFNVLYGKGTFGQNNINFLDYGVMGGSYHLFQFEKDLSEVTINLMLGHINIITCSLMLEEYLNGFYRRLEEYFKHMGLNSVEEFYKNLEKTMSTLHNEYNKDNWKQVITKDIGDGNILVSEYCNWVSRGKFDFVSKRKIENITGGDPPSLTYSKDSDELKINNPYMLIFILYKQTSHILEIMKKKNIPTDSDPNLDIFTKSVIFFILYMRYEYLIATMKESHELSETEKKFVYTNLQTSNSDLNTFITILIENQFEFIFTTYYSLTQFKDRAKFFNEILFELLLRNYGLYPFDVHEESGATHILDDPDIPIRNIHTIIEKFALPYNATITVQ